MKHTHDINKILMNELSVLFACSDEGEYHRITTPFLYQDGDAVVLFSQARGDSVLVTDLALTVGWLWLRMVSDSRSPEQDRLIQDACDLHGVSFEKNEIAAVWKADGSSESFAEVILRVAQAAMRVSDLLPLFRAQEKEQSEAVC